MKIFQKPVFFYRGYTQALFFCALVLYVLTFQQLDIFEGTLVDTLMDAVGIASLIAGEILRIWGVSHTGKFTRSRRIKAQMLITSGPYAYVRNPIYVGNFLIGLGFVFLSGAWLFIAAFLVLFGIQYGIITSEEENFLRDKFGAEYDRYCSRTPKYIPRSGIQRNHLTFGFHFPLKELGTALGILVGGCFFKWIESPVNHRWVLSLFHLVTGGIAL